METKPLRIGIPVLKGPCARYCEVLSLLGAEPVLIKSTDFRLSDYDGLLMPGSASDVCPERYGQNPEPGGASGMNPALDEHQFSVLDTFVKAGKPVFGICRGHQLLNVYFGGTLIQNIPQAERHICGQIYLAHGSDADADGFLAPLYGTRFPVNTSHHEAVGVSGKGMRVVQRSDDGVVEAQQHETLPVWSVQWHPEKMCFDEAREDTVDGAVVLGWFLEQCRHRR